MAHRNARAGFFCGVQDEVDFLEAASQRFFTQDAANAGLRRGNRDLRVGIHPRADADNVEITLAEHFQVMGISVPDAEFIRRRSRPVR